MADEHKTGRLVTATPGAFETTRHGNVRLLHDIEKYRQIKAP